MSRGGERVSVDVSGRIVSSNLDIGFALVREGMGIAAIVTGAYRDDVAQACGITR